QRAHITNITSQIMAIQRKVFRVEQICSSNTSTNSSDTVERQAFRIQSSGLRQLQHEADAIHGAIARTKQELAMLHAGASGHGGRGAGRELDGGIGGSGRAARELT